MQKALQPSMTSGFRLFHDLWTAALAIPVAASLALASPAAAQDQPSQDSRIKRAFLDRYAESVGEYQIRRLTAAMLDDVQAGIHSRRWELQRRCGLAENRMTPLARVFIQWIG